MATISLTSNTTSNDHQSVYENLAEQIDGYNFVFNTSSPYLSGSLIVFYSGAVYIKDDDFIETGEKQFTFLTGDPFPPEINSSLYVSYKKR